MIKVSVGDQDYGFGIAVFVIDEQGTSKRVLRFNGPGYAQSWHLVEVGTTVEPTFTLTAETGRALLQSLTNYYHGADDTRALRKDYDDERKRVDRLVDTVSKLATKGYSQ